MKLHLDDGSRVVLHQADFVAAGGQGAVYAKGDTAYKIYSDPAATLSEEKLRELAAIRSPRVIRPLALLHDRKSGRPVGFTMRFVRDAIPLAQLIPRGFKERNGIRQDAVLRLIGALREGVEAAHAAGVLIVDLHELNLLTDRRFRELWFVDVDNWQTPRHPARAVLESVRDPHAPAPCVGSDWYAFAILAFQLLVGLHPFKGRHPKVRALADRMRLDLSVLDPSVRVPAAAAPFDTIPVQLLDWFRAVFQEGHRDAPPTNLRPAPKVAGKTVVPRVKTAPTGALSARELASFPTPIVAVAGEEGLLVVLTQDALFVDGRRLPLSLGTRGARDLILLPKTQRPILVGAEGELLDALRDQPIPLSLRVDEVVVAGSRVVVRTRDKLVELDFLETRGGVVVSSRVIASVLEHATHLFPGVAVQNLLGATWLHWLTAPGTCPSLHVPDLDGRRIVDARADGSVAALLVAGKKGYDRWIVRRDEAAGTYDVRVSRDVGPTELDLTCLSSGVAVARVEDGLEAFRARPGKGDVRHVFADGMTGGRLGKRGRQVLLSRGERLFALSLAP